MAPDDLADFTSLAARVGIAVPDLLRAWIETGRTSLPEALDTSFSEFLADRPLALVGHPDLEWLSLAEARETVDEWLFAEAQNGVAFLPFARSGAGDMYALVRTSDGRTGCGLVWHDEETSEFAYPDFETWAAIAFAEALTDLGAVIERVAEGRALEAVRTDLRQAAPFLPRGVAATLTDWAARDIATRSFLAGPRARPYDVQSVISQQELGEFTAGLERSEPIKLAVTPPWDLP